MPREEFIRVVQGWVDEIKANQDNYDAETRALALFAAKRFADAARLFTESADADVRQLEARLAEVETLTNEAVRKFRGAGDAYYNAYRFSDALTEYQKAL